MAEIRNNKFYTLSAAAYSAISDIKGTEELFPEFLKWAREGYMEFNFDTSYEIHFAEIKMKSWKQIDWPDDMVWWHKIGFRVGDVVKVFTNDESAPKSFDEINCVKQENLPAAAADLSSISANELAPFLGTDDFFAPGQDHFYGAMLNYNYRGYFDVDARQRVFNFKRVVSNVNTVYLEYITDGINYDGQTIVPPQAFKNIVDYCHWQRREHADDPGAERAKRIYEDGLDKVMVRNLKLSLDDIREALWSGQKQTPKG